MAITQLIFLTRGCMGVPVARVVSGWRGLIVDIGCVEILELTFEKLTDTLYITITIIFIEWSTLTVTGELPRLTLSGLPPSPGTWDTFLLLHTVTR